MRKEFIAIATMAFLFAISCRKQDAGEGTLNLQSPSGLRIAASVDDLKKDAAAAITRKYGSPRDINITAIRYLPVGKGYAAIVDYRLADGTAGNYAVLYRTNYKIASEEDVYSANRQVHMVCASTGECDCYVTNVKIDDEAGTVSFSCSCGACIPVIIVTEN